MDKRYQVFISSTYTDLVEERQQVMQTLLEMDCIPTGMELFPAADEEQFEFIKKVIDDCDYYILIVGGRYGSTTVEGISFTEKEFDYAVEKDIHVIALVHGDPDSIPAGKSELEPEAREKLDAFREKVCTGRIVKKWQRAEDLPGIVALSLNRAMKAHPAVGWVRADSIKDTELLEQILELRNENDELRRSLTEKRPAVAIREDALAAGDDEFEVSVFWQLESRYPPTTNQVKTSWNEIVALLGPHLLQRTHESAANRLLAEGIIRRHGITKNKLFSCGVTDEEFQTVKVQLMALGLIKVEALTTTAKTIALFWSLTQKGEEAMLRERSVKKTQEEQS